MAANRPRGRQKNVTGQGKSIKRRGAGLGTGPVGGAGRGSEIGGVGAPSAHGSVGMGEGQLLSSGNRPYRTGEE